MTDDHVRDASSGGSWTVLDALPEAIALLDADLVIRFLNAHFRELVAPDPEAERFATGKRYTACRSARLGPGAIDAEALAAAVLGKPGARLGAGRPGSGAEGRWFETRFLPHQEAGKPMVLVVKRDVTAYKHAETSLARFHAVLSAVGYAAAQFLGTSDWERSVSDVLGQLGRATDVSRVYVFEMHHGDGGKLLASQRWEWAAEGVAPQLDNPDLLDMPFEEAGFGRWIEVLASQEPIHGLVRDFPAGERAILEPQDIVSLAVLPIFVDDVWWGFIGFDECRKERDWSVPEVQALRAAAGLFGAAIQHQRARAALRQSLAQEALIKAQEAALLQLSTPLIPVRDDLVVMPLVGALDERRMERVLETLLAGITERSARTAILDVTGIPRIDGHAADALLRVARAARLLGAEVMLSGIRPEVARTLIATGADFTGLRTTASLETALSLSLRRAQA
jgi:anti-anti-sigma regulatory factor